MSEAKAHLLTVLATFIVPHHVYYIEKVAAVQGHIDMVTEKNNEVQHDFFKDGIRLQRNGDWLKVRGRLSSNLQDVGKTISKSSADGTMSQQEKDLNCFHDSQCFSYFRQMGLHWAQVITFH